MDLDAKADSLLHHYSCADFCPAISLGLSNYSSL